MPSLIELLVIVVLIGLSGVFAAYEMALAAVSHARLVALERQGVRGAGAAVFMKLHIERSFAVIQLGITFLGAITAAFGGLSVEEKLSPTLEQMGFSPGASDVIALATVVLPLSALMIVFAELVPKVLAIRHREGICLALSPPMRAIASVIAPVVTVFERIVRRVVDLVTRGRRGRTRRPEAASLHELTAAAALARTSGLIGAREERIVHSAASLSSREVGEIALPASDISMLRADATLEQALVSAHLDMHTRFPVARVEGDPQSIEGYVTFKDLVALLKMAGGEAVSLRAATRPLQRVEGTMAISTALDRMVRERTHIALVVDEQDRVTGMITLEDIIEELVGDIEDEFDRLPGHIQPTGDGFIVGGGVLLDAFARRLGVELPAAPAAAGASGEPQRPLTFADWVEKQVGYPPRGGEMVALHGLTVSVRKLRRKKLAEAFVRRVAAPVQPTA